MDIYILGQFVQPFIGKHGRATFEAVGSRVCSSEAVGSMMGRSASSGVAPTAKDFRDAVCGTPWSGFRSPVTVQLGALLALDHWDRSVNERYGLASDEEVLAKALAIMDPTEAET